MQALYNPNRTEILVGPGRSIHQQLYEELRSHEQGSQMTFLTVRDLYPQFKYSDLVQHRAMILIPYQVWCYCLDVIGRLAVTNNLMLSSHHNLPGQSDLKNDSTNAAAVWHACSLVRL
jgi:hypothetical protein